MLGQRCSTLAGTITPTPPTIDAESWQSTASATGTADAAESMVSTASRSRMTADAGKLTVAASEYESMEAHNTAALKAVTSGLPAGAGGDGGAAGLGWGS